jgi:hypothetical protein
LKRSLLALLLGLTACVNTETTLTDRSDLLPLGEDYKPKIVGWAKDFFYDPRSLRGVQVSEPVPVRDNTGRLMWLVCMEADAKQANGAYMGPQRFAFGFTRAGYASYPLQRVEARIAKRDCDQLPLVWRRPWPALERL